MTITTAMLIFSAL